MNRQQKETVIKDINSQFNGAKASFLVAYKGLSVAQLHDLRKQLHKVEGAFKVSKARLMKIAAKDIAGMDEYKNLFKNQIGLVFVKNEVPSVAKTIVEFEKNNEQFSIISGFFESKVMAKAEIETIASLPSRDVLLAILAGTIQAPIACLARALNKIAEKKA